VGKTARGHVTMKNGRYRTRVRFPDGTREFRWLTPGSTEAEARAESSVIAKWAKEGSIKPTTVEPIVAPAYETVAQWWTRYIDARAAKGQRAVADARGMLKNWIAKPIGDLAMRAVARADIERLVRSLDAAVDEERISWKTAANIWGEVTGGFKKAKSSKVQALRARDDDPTDGVEGPDRGLGKSKPILYPDEATRLLACELVPLDRRHVYAVAIYTAARSNELAAISASSLDLAHGVITIAVQRDRKTDDDVSTKTKFQRSFPIEWELLPLVALLARARPSGRILDLPVDEERAKFLRADLLTAGVHRAALHEGTKTALPIWLHHLRDTGLTWCCVRGDDPMRIQSRAGHTNFTTTQKYIATARNLPPDFGDPFPPLPLEIYPRNLATEALAMRDSLRKQARKLASPTGFEPMGGGSDSGSLGVSWGPSRRIEPRETDSATDLATATSQEIAPDGSDLEAPFVGRPAALQANRALRKCLLAATTYPADELALRRTRGAS